MGILNITPDSFFSQGRYYQNIDQAVRYAEQMVSEGVDIIDIGGESTRPGAKTVSVQEELDRVIPLITQLKQILSVPISIDTSQPQVMREAVSAGASMINDVRALTKENALTTAAALRVPVCLMYMGGSKEKDIITATKEFLQEKIHQCLAAGIAQEHIIIDPGFGSGSFGKNTQENLTLLHRLNEFQCLGYPILVGLSRKIFIGEILGGVATEHRLYASLGAAVVAVEHGATIVRTHDVKPTVEALKVYLA